MPVVARELEEGLDLVPKQHNSQLNPENNMTYHRLETILHSQRSFSHKFESQQISLGAE